jgi:hypothetical protein
MNNFELSFFVIYDLRNERICIYSPHCVEKFTVHRVFPELKVTINELHSEITNIALFNIFLNNLKNKEVYEFSKDLELIFTAEAPDESLERHNF